MLRWRLGKEYPRAVTAMCGKYAVQDNREIPDTMEALWEFEGGPVGPSMMMFAYKTNGMVGIQDMMPLNTKRYQIYPLFCRVSETDKASQGCVLSYQDTYRVTDLV